MDKKYIEVQVIEKTTTVDLFETFLATATIGIVVAVVVLGVQAMYVLSTIDTLKVIGQ